MPLILDAELAGLPAALAGEFELEQELGRGGMGVVFRARDTVLDRYVALKVLPPALGGNPEIRTRFLREARTAGQLSHPHIVPIHRADEKGGFAFFIMAFVDGETLGERVRDRGPLPYKEVVRSLRESAWALAYAHARGVVHRDVKPENIMIERSTGRTVVTDFGIARNEQTPGLTADGHVVGTAHFMSPEQIQGGAIDGRSDLYALGVVGYFLLSGKLPFEGATAPAVLVAHVTKRPSPLRDVAPEVPRKLAEVIERCLAKDPRDRYESGESLEEALVAALGDPSTDRKGEQHRHEILSEAQAAAVWRRAAQLQAEAAARLERQSREARTQVAAANIAPVTPQGGTSPTSNTPAAYPPTAHYDVRLVESAAVEAGISQRFVALALSELPSDSDLAELEPENPSIRDRVGSTVIGTIRRSLSISRIIRSPARDVLQAIGRTFQGTPYNLILREQIGPHPLDGGILVFKIPDMATTSTGYPFTWTRYGLYAKEMRVTLRQLENDRDACEVSIFMDLRPGIGVNVWGYSGLTAGFTGGASVVGGIVAWKALALGSFLALGPAALTGFAAGALAVGISRKLYGKQLVTSSRELDDLLLAIETSLRSRSIFEDDRPIAPRVEPPRLPDGT